MVLLAALGAREIITYDHVAHLRLVEIRCVLVALTDETAAQASVYGADEATIRTRLDAAGRLAADSGPDCAARGDGD